MIKNKTEFYDNYIDEIKLSFIKETLSYNSYEATKNCWLGNMIDFIIKKDNEMFLDKIKEWFSSDFKEPKNCYNHGLDYELLMVLTNDLLPSLKSLKKYTTFYEQITSNKRSVSSYMKEDCSKIEKFRDKYLKLANTQELESDILKAWQDNLEKFIPCPSTANKARYASHAKWLEIAKEINKEVYNKVLSDWRKNQFRKRNLWYELESYGITKK